MIDWFKTLFGPTPCGICSSKLDADYGVIYFKASDYDDPQQMKVCSACMSLLEESHKQTRKRIEHDKKVMNVPKPV